MLAPILAVSLFILHVTADALPTTTLEIDTALPSDYPFPYPTPFWTLPPPTLVGRQWEWASIPAWYTPSPPSPSPPVYYNGESQHKATLTHEIIAAIIVGIFIGFPVLGCACVWGYRRLWVKRRRVDVERGRRLVRDCERKRVFVDGDYVTRLTERPDMVHWGKDRR
jgi:hypothetical protein